MGFERIMALRIKSGRQIGARGRDTVTLDSLDRHDPKPYAAQRPSVTGEVEVI